MKSGNSLPRKCKGRKESSFYTEDGKHPWQRHLQYYKDPSLSLPLISSGKVCPAVTLISISSCSRCQALSTGAFSVISEFPQLGTWAE